jgi:hypothetical protein
MSGLHINIPALNTHKKWGSYCATCHTIETSCDPLPRPASSTTLLRPHPQPKHRHRHLPPPPPSPNPSTTGAYRWPRQPRILTLTHPHVTTTDWHSSVALSAPSHQVAPGRHSHPQSEASIQNSDTTSPLRVRTAHTRPVALQCFQGKNLVLYAW